MNEPNPYKAPASPAIVGSDPSDIILDPKDLKKAQAVVKDAGQFWLAILLCILCSIIGALLIPIWYTVRLVQWNSLANAYPALVVANAPKASFAAKFKSSRWKLIVGLVVGVVIFGWVILNVFTAIQAVQDAAR